MNLQFFLRFHTKFGQSLWLSGNIEELGMNDPAKALPMNYLDDQFWYTNISITKKKKLKDGIRYKYYLRTEDGEWIGEWGHDKMIPGDLPKETEEIQLLDTWNHAGEYENAFYTAPFNNVLLKEGHTKCNEKSATHYTHTFKVKAPLLKKNEVVCLLGNNEKLGNWNTEEPVLLYKKITGGQ